MNVARKEAVTKFLIEQANAAHAQYQQYANHWDGWILVRIRETIRTKMGVAFEAGEIALAKPKSERIDGGRYRGHLGRTLYSVRNQCDTAVLEREVERIEPERNPEVGDKVRYEYRTGLFMRGTVLYVENNRTEVDWGIHGNLTNDIQDLELDWYD